MSLNKVVWWLVVLGAVNWGLSVLNFNIVDLMFSGLPAVAQIVYLLVGVSGVYLLVAELGGTGKRAKKKR